jgi:hypothetical protein
LPNRQSIDLTIHNKDDVLVIIISVQSIKKKQEKKHKFLTIAISGTIEVSQNEGCFNIFICWIKMSKINFTIASILLFGTGFNASRWFEISTVEQFDNQFNETVALIQVRLS